MTQVHYREVSKKRPAVVYGFLRSRLNRLSGLTLREGSKYLPDAQRRARSRTLE